MYSNGYSNINILQTSEADGGCAYEMVMDLGGDQARFQIKKDGELIGDNNLKAKKLIPFIMVKWRGTKLTTKIIKN